MHKSLLFVTGDSSPRSSSQVPLPAWKSVQVLVYSNKIGAAERVLEKIDKHIKQNQATKQEEDRIICRFSPKQVDLIFIPDMAALY